MFDQISQYAELIIELFALLVMGVSLFALIIPIFPGLVVIWVAALVSGLVNGFSSFALIIFGILTVLTIIGVLIDNFLMGSKARQHGAAWRSILLALLAGVLGTFLLPPIGGIIAAPLVLYAMEYRRLRDPKQAQAVVKALLIGWGWAFVARFGIGVVMIVLWAIWVFRT